MKILVTGCCGFIGFHITKELLNNKISEKIENTFGKEMKELGYLI